MKSSVRDVCPLQNLFSNKITHKLLSVFFASSLTMKKRKPAVLYCNRIQTWNVASSNFLENNLFFKTLITLEPKVPHSSDASQNDHKSKSYLPVYWCGLRLMRIDAHWCASANIGAWPIIIDECFWATPGEVHLSGDGLLEADHQHLLLPANHCELWIDTISHLMSSHCGFGGCNIGKGGSML